MNWVDIILIIVLLGGVALGTISGFIWQVARLVLLILSAYLTFLIHPFISVWFLFNFTNRFVANVILFIIIFGIIYLILFFITWFIEKGIATIELKPLDRVIGGIVGFLKTALICGTILAAIVRYAPPETHQTLKHSLLSRYLIEYTRRVVFLMPRDYRSALKHFVDQTSVPIPPPPQESIRQ